MDKKSNSILQQDYLSQFISFVVRNQVFCSIVSLILFTLLVYFPVFSHQFLTKWDDQWVVINVYTENGLTKYNLWAILTEFYHGQYAPVNQLSYTLLYSAFGYNPFWFHSLGVLIHICNIILVYFFIEKLLTQGGGYEISSIQRIAFFTALIMAIHPFLVEPVAWLSASKVLIYAFFYLIAMHLYLKYILSPGIKYYLLVLLFFILSFGGKEQAVTLPACMLLIDYVLKRNLRNKWVWIEKIPLFILAIFFGYITMLSQGVNGGGLLSKTTHYPFYQNIIFASYSITEYLVKCLIPLKLSYLYPFPNEIGQQVPLRFWIYPILLIIILTSLWDFWKQRWIFFGIVFFVIHLGVALHIIPISRFAIIADRYVYIASIGIFFIIAYFIDHIIKSKKYVNTVKGLSFLYVLSIGIYAHQHSKIWHNSEKLKMELQDLLKKRNDFQKIKSKK